MRLLSKFLPFLSWRSVSLGSYGEKLARKFLKRLGYRILKINYLCPTSEIDIVASDGDTLVFVEVKSRRSAQAGDPEESVNWHKKCQITKAARYFIAQNNAQQVPARFDVIAVVIPEKGKSDITHFIDAFGPTPR